MSPSPPSPLSPPSPALPAKNIVSVFTDGACLDNPGPGGWAALLRWGTHERALTGSAPQTTNNRMELSAVIQALAAITPGVEICITTDSQYVQRGITQWIENWKRRGWRTAARKPVLNQDLWQALDAQVHRHQAAAGTIQWQWVRGHQGHTENERVDGLARQAAEAVATGGGAEGEGDQSA
ncbi:MAG: ribonuclease HI [Pseudomonadota bacterium]